MPIKITQEEFINSCTKKHNGKYDYSKTVYTKGDLKISIICPSHGLFTTRAKKHKNDGSGCPGCAKEAVGLRFKLSQKEFLEKCHEEHGKRYDYSKVKYTHSHDRIEIVCKTHGIFRQIASDHSRGQGCPKCNGGGNETKKITFNVFIERSREKHADKYSYENAKYINTHKKIEITCPIHGSFLQEPMGHMNGFECPVCQFEKRRNTKEYFVDKANSVHYNKYDYSLTVYKEVRKKVKIICPEHEAFYQSPASHLSGSGCPDCNRWQSKMEISTEMILCYHKIQYEKQKTLLGCRYSKPLFFDFYLPDYNTVIECQGEQHYRLVEYWGGHSGFLERNIRDMIKKNYCKREGIRLIEIPYWTGTYDEIRSIISEIFPP